MACRSGMEKHFETTSFESMSVGRARKEHSNLWLFEAAEAIKPTAQYAPEIKWSKADFADLVRKRLSALTPRESVLRVVNQFMSGVPSDIIGLHVRRTDHSRPGDKDQPLQAMLDKVVGETDEAAFLLCTDNRQSAEWLRMRYGKRMFWRKKRMWAIPSVRGVSLRHTSTTDAVIDLYTLSRTTRIIGTSFSSFSYFAAKIGRIPIDAV